MPKKTADSGNVNVSIGGNVHIGRDFVGRDKNETTSSSEYLKIITNLRDVINTSAHLSKKEKAKHIKATDAINKELSKSSPNKEILKNLISGLQIGLQAVPDVAKAIAALTPLLVSLK